MSNNLIFEAAMLRPGKQGIIKPDAAGYYTQCIGGLDIENAAGVVYASDKAKNLFSDSSCLQRRIQNRALRGELGHPRRGPEHKNDNEWLNRLNDIVETRVSTYWAKIELDESYGRNNPHLNRPNMIGIMARYRPGGAHGAALQEDLADPESNVAFSIRAFSIPYTRMGRRFYDLQTIVTWDQVNEPGIAQAAKTLSSTLESMSHQAFTGSQIKRAYEASLTQTATLGSTISTNESRGNLMQLAQLFTIDSGITKPASIYYRWEK